MWGWIVAGIAVVLLIALVVWLFTIGWQMTFRG